MEDDNKLILERKKKLDRIKEKFNPYPNTFKKTDDSILLVEKYKDIEKDDLKNKNVSVSIAGRLLMIREMGNSTFADLHDESGKIQIYLQKKSLPEESKEIIPDLDLGDIAGVKGTLFKTKTNELTVNVLEITLLAKSLRPLPEKFHGISDIEIKYRQRYLDLMTNHDTKNLFKKRTKIISSIRDFFISNDFLEIETPMMHIIPGGATAKPFATYHNTLDMDLYLRVAPELFLKRCIIGGFEKVFEINRSFRNEGLSVKHNPEFTMIEFYSAYQDYVYLMDLIEKMFTDIKKRIEIKDSFEYQNVTIDTNVPFKRIKFYDALFQYNKEINSENISDLKFLNDYAKKSDISITDDKSLFHTHLDIFEKTVEKELINPTFVTHYPTDVSPLARSFDNDQGIAERFELFIAGREVANGFSELNNPYEQSLRFTRQAESTNDEKMSYDKDFITALEYGMPPAAGAGIGIDRLIMILTNSSSIRDVLLFPLMKPKK
tara:strand:+ start:20933 stop:22405 length:1473 start_codon:yes stop_codon:yes gene_type:complete